MQLRVTVPDRDTDLVIECTPQARVGEVLDLARQAVGGEGEATVDGATVDPDQPVATSALCDGALLRFGAPPTIPPAGSVRPALLRVTSGPSAGEELALEPGRPMTVGRSRSADLVLADIDVSKLHLQLVAGDGVVQLADRNSTNGVFVGGQRVEGRAVARFGDEIQIGGSRLTVVEAQAQRAHARHDVDGTVLLNRRYRDRRKPAEPTTVQLPAPNRDEERRPFPILMMVLPALVAVALAVITRRPVYLLFGLLSPMLMAGNWWGERRWRQRRERRQDSRYQDKLAAAMTRVHAAVDDEDAALRAQWPDPSTVLRAAVERRIELWQRRPEDTDWLRLRLGTADRPAAVTVTGELPAGWVQPTVRRAPAGVQLESHAVLGIAGPQQWLTGRVGWALVQCAVWHSPAELTIAVLAPGARQHEYGWLRWLPHIRTLAAWSFDQGDHLLEVLLTDLRGRSAATTGDLLVLMVGNEELYRRRAVKKLLMDGPAAGMRFICTADDERRLPEQCTATLIAMGGEARLSIDGADVITVDPDEITPAVAEVAARSLAPLRLAGAVTLGEMPHLVRLVDLIGEPTPESIRAGWRLSPAQTGVTEVVVGADADGPVSVDLARHGPHTVITGTAGAGKSELLRALIVALAAANSPNRLNFVFIDFKGGETFHDQKRDTGDLTRLPHVVGTATDLDPARAERALLSLNAELQRRKADVGPHPRLVIVVDEFALLKTEMPDMVAGLLAIASQGRSLCVHLVLATQRPAEVNQQILANADLRFCLRVVDGAESANIIDIPDAELIPKHTPGRAYVKRGEQSPQLFQSGTVSIRGQATRSAPSQVRVVGWDRKTGHPGGRDRDGASDRTDLYELIDAVVHAAEAEGIAAPKPAWQPALPRVLPLARLPLEPGSMTLGLQDLPMRQDQRPLRIALGEGHLAIIGSGGSGRTSALRAIAAGLSAVHGPDQMHLYVIDGAGGLAAVGALPHCGVLVASDDTERVNRLLARLLDLVRARRQLLVEHGAGTLTELRERDPRLASAHVVLLIDSWSELNESGAEVTAQVATLRELLRGGVACGVTVVLAGDEQITGRTRIFGQFTHQLFLRLNAGSAAYTDAPRRRLVATLPRGRALWAADSTQVQLPVLTEDPSGSAQNLALHDLALRLPPADAGTGPLRVDPLPERIGLPEALRLTEPPAAAGVRVLLGVGGDRLAGVWATLGRAGRRHVLVAGPAKSGRSTTAAAMAASATSAGARVVLVEAVDGELAGAARAPGVHAVSMAEAAAAIDSGLPDLVVVDDANLVPLDHPLVSRLTADSAPPTVITTRLDMLSSRGLLAIRQQAAAVVVLCPPGVHAAQSADPAISIVSGFSGPPGRAVATAHGGQWLVQVPDITVRR